MSSNAILSRLDMFGIYGIMAGDRTDKNMSELEGLTAILPVLS